MKILEERILKDGHVLGENILKVDSFLTHQVDFKLMKEKIRNAPGNRLLELYQDKNNPELFFTYSYWEIR